MRIQLITFAIFFTLLSCKKNSIRTQRANCDKQFVKTCDGKGNGEYCTFGYKWGTDNPFNNAGLEKPGPGIGNVNLTYGYMEPGFVFNSHSQDNLKSLLWQNFMQSCAKEKIKLAFAEYESITNLKFAEVAANQNPDIKIIVADISQSSFGYPNFNESPCKEMKGLLVFKKNEYGNCETIMGPILHEIGHVLGLGHVVSKNVMHPSNSYLYQNLQPGDVLGIQSIYGKK